MTDRTEVRLVSLYDELVRVKYVFIYNQIIDSLLTQSTLRLEKGVYFGFTRTDSLTGI